jgi:hypothetical protein
VKCIVAICMLFWAWSGVQAQPVITPLSSGGTYDTSILSPGAMLGFVPGDRPARYSQVADYCRYLASKSNRVRLMEMGRTYEGRTLFYLVISDPAHVQKLDQIRGEHARLADPRLADEATARSLAGTLPAVVWIGYGIHGNELSSVDAALHVAYQLAAGTDTLTLRMLNDLVICIDPMQNPDGRERFLAQMEQWSGAMQNPDAQSLHHTGIWPYGRGNHYLFDLNRDWSTLVHPETRFRVQAVLQWRPQVFIDSHEMGAYDTYLFSPPREPINPNVSPNARQWWGVFAKDQARAFDHFGWSYYTREWNDEWYPGYGASWVLYIDAVGILYEQARVEGTLVKRPDGTTLHYNETVHHHVVSSLANLGTASRNRKDLLIRYAAARREAMRSEPGAPRAYALLAGTNPGRVDHLVERLLWQGIEVHRVEREGIVRDATSALGGSVQRVTLPAGTYLVYLDQPASRLARAILEFDPRMISSFLQEERKSLEKDRRSKLYDVTGWSMPLAYGIDAYALNARPDIRAVPVRSIEKPEGRVEGPARPFGYLLPYDDRGLEALARLLASGFKVRSAREPFAIEGQAYERGTLLLRGNENPDTLRESLQKTAATFGITVRAVGTALSTTGPDLGGNDFPLLRAPKIALVGGQDVNTTSFGALWHLFDQQLKIQTTLLPPAGMLSSDLRKYNVIVFPSVGDSPGIHRILDKAGSRRLVDWIENGGTLITMGNASSLVADSGSTLSGVRLRHQVLNTLDAYLRAAELELRASDPVIDSISLWSGTQKVDTLKAARTRARGEKELAMLDERGRLFMPRGAILRVDLDEEDWLCFGAGKVLPAVTFTSSVFLSKNPVRTPARFSDAARLRLSGLLWPEARDRWAGSAYATREQKGRGQLVLFAGEPVYRGAFHGSARLLLNAVLLGPGWGANAED